MTNFKFVYIQWLEGKGLKLFDQIKDRIIFNLLKTKSLKSGVTIFYYEPIQEKQRTANTGFASGGLTCKLEALCFYLSSVVIDSFTRNPPLRQAPKR